MSGLSISFVSDIIGHAKACGLELNRQEIEAISANLNSITTVDGSTVTFTLGRDRVVPLDEAIAAMSAGYGRPAETKAPTASIPAGGNRTEQAIATNAANRANASAAKRQQAQELVQKFGNPWRTNNRTHQAFITNTAPDLVGRLKSEAGVRG